MRALVVDDDPASCQVLRAHLSGIATPCLCQDGATAVLAVIDALAKGESFDVIFLDILMPGMDGHETLDKIREAEDAACCAPEKRAKVVMVTALDDEDNHMTAMFEGLVSAYLVKPVNKLELMKKMKALDLID